MEKAFDTPLKRRREELGLTRLEVVKLADPITERYLELLERGKHTPNIQLALRLAKALKIKNVADLFPLLGGE